MLKKKTIKNFIKKRLQNVAAQIQQYCTTKDGECLHQLRVEIKKTDAVISLMNECANKKHQTNKKLLDSLFKDAGEIRLAFVNIQLMKEHAIADESFINQQNDIIESSSNNFCTEVDNYNALLQKAEKKILKNTTNIDKAAIKNFYKKEIKKLSKAFSTPPDEEQLHNIRKRLKTLLYIFYMLPKKLQSSIKLNVTYVDELQEMIGQWHDAVAAIALIKTAAAHTPIQTLHYKQAELFNAIMSKAADLKNEILNAPFIYND